MIELTWFDVKAAGDYLVDRGLKFLSISQVYVSRSKFHRWIEFHVTPHASAIPIWGQPEDTVDMTKGESTHFAYYHYWKIGEGIVATTCEMIKKVHNPAGRVPDIGSNSLEDADSAGFPTDY